VTFAHRSIVRVAALLLLCVSAGMEVKAQETACPRIDSTASWFVRQRAWLQQGSAGWTDTAFRAALLAVPAFDRAAAQGALLGFEFADERARPVAAADSAMIARLIVLGSQRGSVWPTRSVVGADGVLAVWALAGRDTALARIALKRMMEAGPDESPPAAVALLEDRMRVRAGRKQLYGTQVRRIARINSRGRYLVEPLATEDPAHLALRRDGAELPPLAQSLCVARSAAASAAADRKTTDH
jgi:hypothetical protein